MKKTDLKIESLKISDIIPYVNNQKKHPQEQIDIIKSSILEFGVVNPILIDDKNVIIAGHGRFEALKQLNYDEIPVIRVSNLTEAQIKAYRIADNKIAEMSSWDNDLLAIDIQELKELEFDLENIGIDFEFDLEEDLEADDDFFEEEEESNKKEVIKLVVICDNETDKMQLKEELLSKGYLCQ